MAKSLEDILNSVAGESYNESTVILMKRLIAVIDASFSQAFKLTGHDRAEFLSKSLLNLRDILASELNSEFTKQKVLKDIYQAVIDETTPKPLVEEDTKKKEVNDLQDQG